MTGRQTTPRQEPLGPEVGLSELVTRMISANRTERARRLKRVDDHPSKRDEESTRGKPESPLT
jgi:hypothetical protein